MNKNRLTSQIHSDSQSYAPFCALAIARLLHKNALRFAAGDYGRYPEVYQKLVKKWGLSLKDAL